MALYRVNNWLSYIAVLSKKLKNHVLDSNIEQFCSTIEGLPLFIFTYESSMFQY